MPEVKLYYMIFDNRFDYIAMDLNVIICFVVDYMSKRNNCDRLCFFSMDLVII